MSYLNCMTGRGTPDNATAWRRGPALGGPGFYRFYVTRVLGPCMRHYNVPNDRTLSPSTGGV